MTRRVRLPARLAERALAYARAGGTPVAPRDAATVVLLRDGPDGVQAYLLRRVRSMAFAPGMHVFPGGRVDPRDGGVDTGWAGPSRDAWAAVLGVDEGLAAALVCAAVRETFEESGVLLAGCQAGDVVADTTGPEWERDRLALLQRRLPFARLLRDRGLALRTDLLRAWSRWITPEFEERRYDTRFFVAALPIGQRARDVGGEADLAGWLRPAEALDAQARGELHLMPPTAATLGQLAGYASVAEVLAAAAGRSLRPVLPRAHVHDGAVELEVPDPGEGP